MLFFKKLCFVQCRRRGDCGYALPPLLRKCIHISHMSIWTRKSPLFWGRQKLALLQNRVVKPCYAAQPAAGKWGRTFLGLQWLPLSEEVTEWIRECYVFGLSSSRVMSGLSFSVLHFFDFSVCQQKSGTCKHLCHTRTAVVRIFWRKGWPTNYWAIALNGLSFFSRTCADLHKNFTTRPSDKDCYCGGLLCV